MFNSQDIEALEELKAIQDKISQEEFEEGQGFVKSIKAGYNPSSRHVRNHGALKNKLMSEEATVQCCEIYCSWLFKHWYNK